MPARQVISELQQNQFDAYLDYVPVERSPANVDTIRLGRPQPEWQRNAYDRYVATTIKLPSAIRWPTKNRPQIVIRSSFLLAPFLPYSRVLEVLCRRFLVYSQSHRSKNTVIGHSRREEIPQASAKALCCGRNIPSHGPG